MKTPGGTFVATRSAMWFGGLYGVVKTVTLGVLGYVSLVALVRISGKRTLAKMNAFDLVITVATLEGVNGADATLPNQRFTVSRAN